MPCTDVTEVLSLTLDPDDRLVHYTLTKLTCGGGVGNPSLLRKWIDRKSCDEILAATSHQLLQEFPTTGDTWEYVTIKHLKAVQTGLRVLVGTIPSGPNEVCSVETIEYGPKGIRMLALIKIDVLTDEIEACGGCSSCGNSAE